MKKIHLSQPFKFIISGVMYYALKVEKAFNSLVRSKKYSFKLKNILNSSKQNLRTDYEDRKRKSDDIIASRQKITAEFLARNSVK